MIERVQVPISSIALLKVTVREFIRFRGICPECECEFDAQHKPKCKLGKALAETYPEAH